jgi:hypothetical protein
MSDPGQPAPKTRPRPPEFLERSSYRLRRLMDAARLLPVFGLILLLLPLMRDHSATGQGSIATEAVYLFGVWLGLVLIALGMSLGLRRALPPPPDAAPPDQDPR